MKGDKKVIGNLNAGFKMEMGAVRQYMLHAHVLAAWGLGKLATKFKEEMTEELAHADAFLARLLLLEASPDTSLDGRAVQSSSLHEMFTSDLESEVEARTYYMQAAKIAHSSGDPGTYDLFLKTAIEEESHIEWLEAQIDLLGRIGEVAYTQMHLD